MPAKPKVDLLARILAEPENMEPRLVYADQLIEKDDPRGRFITEQCQLAELDSVAPKYAALLASTRRLEAKHGRAWLGGGKALKNAVFERGFVYRVAMPPIQVNKERPALAKREPLRALELLVGEGVMDSEKADLGGLDALKISPEGWFTGHSLKMIFEWGDLAITELDISRVDLQGRHGSEIVAQMKGLTSLIAHTSSAGDEGAALLFGALTKLEKLDVGGWRLRDKASLEAMKKLNLVELGLSGNADLKGSFGVLAGWKSLGNLKHLALPQVLTVDELKALFPKPSTKLRSLALASAKELGKAPAAIVAVATALSHLDIGTTSVGDEGFATILGAKSTANLLELQANGCSLSDKGIKTLTSSKLKSLVKLDLSSNKLTDAAVATLADWAGLEHVVELRLGNNRKLFDYDPLILAKHFAPVRLDIGKTKDKELIDKLTERFGKEAIVVSV